MKKKVLVLGAGLVGATIAKELASDFRVSVIDKCSESLDKLDDEGISCEHLDFFATNDGFKEQFDIIVGALPGSIGYKAAKTVLGLGIDYVDISFAPEDLRELTDLALATSAKCIIDFGVAPGLSHLIFGHLQSILKRVNEYYIYVAGLLKNPEPPWYYKASWSPADVIEEYIRPARFVADGGIKTLPALSMPQFLYVNCDRVSDIKMEAFLTDGVRTLLSAENVDTIIERTIRPVGYRENIQLLIDSGFFSLESIAGTQISPRDVTEKLLISSWKMNEEDEDITVMKLVAKGTDYMDHEFHAEYNLLDRHDGTNSSMARTTGFMCTAGVRLLAQNLWKKIGVFAPEEIGANRSCFEFIIDDLKRHGIQFT